MISLFLIRCYFFSYSSSSSFTVSYFLSISMTPYSAPSLQPQTQIFISPNNQDCPTFFNIFHAKPTQNYQQVTFHIHIFIYSIYSTFCIFILYHLITPFLPILALSYIYPLYKYIVA